MRSKLRAAKIILQARERMRNIAAMEVSLADQNYQECDSIRIKTERSRQTFLASAQERLSQIRLVSELEWLDIEMKTEDRALCDAEEQANHALDLRQKAETQLRERELAVRQSEKLVSKKKQELRKSVERKEQALVDDLVAGRWKNHE